MNTPALDVKKAWITRELKHDRQLFRAQFSPDGKFIAAGGQDKLVYVWELEGEKKKAFNKNPFKKITKKHIFNNSLKHDETTHLHVGLKHMKY